MSRFEAARPVFDLFDLRTVTLWELMRKAELSGLLKILDLLRTAEAGLAEAVRANAFEVDGRQESRAAFRAAVKDILSRLQMMCAAHGLANSVTALARAIVDLPQSDREMAVYMNQVKDELGQHLFVQIPVDRASYWENDDLLSADLKYKFSDPASELRLAANAYACALPTACVLHAMRAAESGLGIVANALGVSMVGDENMRNLVDGIQKAAKNLDDVPKHPNKKADSQFYCEIALEAGLMKDAWRNHAAHAKSVYTEPQSRDVLNATIRFFEKLSERFSQTVNQTAP